MSSQELNLAVVGSQIVGIVPLKALMDAAEYYMKKDNLFILEEDQKLRLVREMALTKGSCHKNWSVTLLQQLVSLIWRLCCTWRGWVFVTDWEALIVTKWKLWVGGKLGGRGGHGHNLLWQAAPVSSGQWINFKEEESIQWYDILSEEWSKHWPRLCDF